MNAVPKPMPRQGSVAQRWEKWRNLNRARVSVRARGKCESCGAQPGRLDWAHLAGRRNIVSEPWASSEMLTCALCRDCHRAIDENRDPAKLDGLRDEANVRLRRHLGLLDAPSFRIEAQIGATTVALQMSSLDSIRELIRYAEANGIEP